MSEWETCKFEQLLETCLLSELGEHQGKMLFGNYTSAREYLLKNIFKEVSRVEPGLTDHSADHIKNVLDNIYDLVFIEEKPFAAMDIYILALAGIFHDVGNIHGRTDHNIKIGDIYDAARRVPGGNQDHEEKSIILNICRAHSGKIAGNANTLQTVDSSAKIHRCPVSPQQLAAILRFADELAEGEQRTSQYMLEKAKYPTDNAIFHKYASCSAIDIDRLQGRINLSYHISIADEKNMSKQSHVTMEEMPDFLRFVYKRIEKLDQERQYAKYYAPSLSVFKETSAKINFWYLSEKISVDLSTIVYSDLIVPGYPQRHIEEIDPKYSPDYLIDLITSAIYEGENT